ncbi:MAG: hypothetical protein OK474_11255 [Thaumarchaeota archaeon]|nr:hypothetical protein [Nitrososphaerota archaeon]
MPPKEKKSRLPIRINREPPPPVLVPFTEVFKGFGRVEAVRRVFGEDTEEIIGRLQIRLIPSRYMYMGVNDQDGNLAVGTYHLKHSDLNILYLDIIHELFHVDQFMQDKEWFGKEHRRYLKTGFDTSLYYKSPIEIPAYKHAVDEAMRIGMAHDEIVEYLRIGPVDSKVFAEFLESMELRPDMAKAPAPEIPVYIDREGSVPVFPFTDYFIGFEELPAVKALFGERAEEVLANLKIAFSPSTFGFISLNEEDGNLEVGMQYLEDGDERLIYMDILLCLNLLKRPSGRENDPDTDPQSFGQNPVVIKSYQIAVAEARRVGTPDSKILGHLQTLNFIMPPPVFERFVVNIGLKKR